LSESGITHRLARFLVESRWSDVPQPVRHEAKRATLNWLGCALGGCRDDAVARALATLDEFSGPRRATLIGRGEKLDALNTALINALSANILDYDDTHLKTLIHPTVPVAATALALAEHRPVTGAQFLHALILGVETACRIGNAVSPGHYAAGWHITATCGVFGAAAVALIHGAAGVRQFSDACVRDPAVIALREKVVPQADARLEKIEGYVSITLRDGRRLDRHVAHAIGTLEHPMSDAAIEAKFRDLAADVLPERQALDTIELVWSLDRNSDAASLARAAVPARAAYAASS
jgi:2-methylcitrate dehydratase PrpD